MRQGKGLSMSTLHGQAEAKCRRGFQDTKVAGPAWAEDKEESDGAQQDSPRTGLKRVL